MVFVLPYTKKPCFVLCFLFLFFSVIGLNRLVFLSRWAFVTHGCIDGFSRIITFLKCNVDNRSSTVLTEFVSACSYYGLQSRVRSDHVNENTQMALFLNLLRNGSHHITGKSTHDQRIVRLW